MLYMKLVYLVIGLGPLPVTMKMAAQVLLFIVNSLGSICHAIFPVSTSYFVVKNVEF